jgi:hypothetical protein
LWICSEADVEWSKNFLSGEELLSSEMSLFPLVKKLIARHPCGTQNDYYRCFLPDLTGFVTLCCAGPGYQLTEISNSFCSSP